MALVPEHKARGLGQWMAGPERGSEPPAQTR